MPPSAAAQEPLSARIIEVIADRGTGRTPRYRYGSGCIVRGRTVLTAAHVVAGARAVEVRRPDKQLMPARADERFIGGQGGPDLALVSIEDERINLAAIQLAVVDRDSPTGREVRDCHAIGYPWFAERPPAETGDPSPAWTRDTVDAVGFVPALSKLAGGLLTVQVTNSPRPLPPADVALGESEWSGMSGAPVVADGYLLGVVSAHAPREGPTAITAVPLSALELDPAHPGWGPGVANAPAWWDRLGVHGLADLRRLPEAASDPDSDSSQASAGPMSPLDRRRLLDELCDIYHDRWRIDGILDDLGFPPGRRPVIDGPVEQTWRAILRELDAGRIGDGYSLLLALVLERYPHNHVIGELAQRYGTTPPAADSLSA